MKGDINGGVFTPVNLALYTYTWNNPVVFRDPKGLSKARSPRGPNTSEMEFRRLENYFQTVGREGTNPPPGISSAEWAEFRRARNAADAARFGAVLRGERHFNAATIGAREAKPEIRPSRQTEAGPGRNAAENEQMMSLPDPPASLGPADPPQRFQGPWTPGDLRRASEGKPPEQMGLGEGVKPELHHADQMPGSGIHEVHPGTGPGQHRALEMHGQPKQGVTPDMRRRDTQRHWWFRGQEMGNPPPSKKK
jgi:hypothetical protein